MQMMYFISAFLAAIMCNLILSVRYKRMLLAMGEILSTIKSFVIQNIALSIAYISPFRLSSVIVKPTATKVFARIPIKKSMIVTVFDSVYDMGWEALLLPILLILLGYGFIDVRVAIVLISVYFVSVIFLYRFRSRIFPILMKICSYMPKKISRYLPGSINRKNVKKSIAESITYLKNKRLFTEITFLTFLVFLIAPLILSFSAMVFNENLNYFHGVAIYWVSMAIGRLSGIPGGFGSRDLTMGGLLLGAGLNPVSITGIVVLYRIISLSSVFSVSGISFVFLSEEIRRIMKTDKKRQPV